MNAVIPAAMARRLMASMLAETLATAATPPRPIQVNDPIRPRELTMIQGEQITVPVRSSVHTFSSVDLRAAQAVICICGPSRNGTMRFLAPTSAKSSCSTHPRRP
jgi:hypothetical protein